MPRFASNEQRVTFTATKSVLRSIGYSGRLLEEDYAYPDWFAHGTVRRADAAAFGRTPPSYETALFAIEVSHGDRGEVLASGTRALGAPILLEVGSDEISQWAVGSREVARLNRFSRDGFSRWAEEHRSELGPRELLRTKTLGSGSQFYQQTLFAGLIPELEETIAQTLQPLLKAAFKAGETTYRATAGTDPSESRLFTTAFWILAGKVFADRGHDDFAEFAESLAPDVDSVLDRVAQHYSEPPTRHLNRRTRESIFRHVWSKMDFRNISVEVLAQIWAQFLVTPSLRRSLGIHRTPRSIVHFITERIPFEAFPQSERFVVEPCSGSATFLVGALDRLRELLPKSWSASDRHGYFREMLKGYEKDPFGRELGRFCLALADYPEGNGWDITNENVFTSRSFGTSLERARVVLCNPPFGDFSKKEMREYGAATSAQPAELLNRVITSLHSDGVLGFVLPRTFIDGVSYRQVRRRIADRFDRVEVVALPDKAWEDADKETALLIATEPRLSGRTSVHFSVVRERQWHDFDQFQIVGSSDCLEKSPADAEVSLAVPELREVWEHLAFCDTLKAHTRRISRGVEWNTEVPQSERVLDAPRKGWHRGVHPLTKHLRSFECPPIVYLDFRKASRRRRAFECPWDEPKVLINKAAKSRGPWRVAAYADFSGLAAAQNYLALWPDNDADTKLIAAILNGPLANAFVTTREGKTDITKDTVEDIPFPHVTDVLRDMVERLVSEYLDAIHSERWDSAAASLRNIDAHVLDAYRLPAYLEKKLLDFFHGSGRNSLVPFTFSDYYPLGLAVSFSLKEWLSGRPQQATVERFRSQPRDLPQHILDAIAHTEDRSD